MTIPISKYIVKKFSLNDVYQQEKPQYIEFLLFCSDRLVGVSTVGCQQ